MFSTVGPLWEEFETKKYLKLTKTRKCYEARPLPFGYTKQLLFT